jgi:DNA-binding NarL/FixJ family response regulator
MVAVRLVDPRLLPRLSRRQAAIVELAAAGLSDKEIAGHLEIAHSTVASHWDRLARASRLRGRTALVAAWLLSDQCSDIQRDQVRSRLRWRAGR